jgi:PAS domain S-box-containing protein
MEVFDAMELISSAIASASNTDELLGSVLESMLDIFTCDRAWILNPCAPVGDHIEIRMERNRPEYPGALEDQAALPIDEGMLAFQKSLLAADGPMALFTDANSKESIHETQRRFSVKSQLAMALHPKGAASWVLGIHHCREEVHYDGVRRLFGTIARSVADGLAALIATKQLRESEVRFRTLVERAPEAIVILDCDHECFADGNPNAEALFGLPVEELIKTGPTQMSPEFQSSGVASSIGAATYIRAALEGEYPSFDWEHANADGEVIPCEVRLALLPHLTRKLLRGSITDISSRLQAEEERRELEAHLAQAQKMEAIGNLTGGIAHDFNNLLTVIIGNLDLLSVDPGNPKFVAEQVAQIRAASERATSLTHRLLAFARRQPLQPTSVDAGELLEGMGDLLRRTLGETIEVDIVAPIYLWRCDVDATQLENAVLNLAINARDAMPQGGQLMIRASNANQVPKEDIDDSDGEGQFVLVTVSDNGDGMSEDVLEQVFAPFFTTKEVGKGSGLGLSMVYGFVRQSGGHVRVSSTLGRGTVMKLYLPRASNATDTGATTKAGPRLARSTRIASI